MARSQIIKDLINGDEAITSSLQKLFVIVNELENKELNKWVKNELNGYKINDEVPDYRKNLPYRILYSGINGSFKVINQPFTIQMFGDFSDNIKSLNVVNNSIFELENFKNKTMQLDLTMYADYIRKSTGISCFSIVLKYGCNVSDIIISNVKTKILESLLLLEREFGLLDELFIKESKLNNNKINEVNSNINSIIFSDGVRY